MMASAFGITKRDVVNVVKDVNTALMEWSGLNGLRMRRGENEQVQVL